MIRALLAAASVAIWNTAPAQAPGAERAPRQSMGLVRGQDGAPLADAEVLAFRSAPTDDVVGAEGLAPRPAPLRTQTDARGEFRLDLTSPATVLVRGHGLGLLVPALAAEDALRLVAQPLAEVVLPAGAAGARALAAVGGVEVDLGVLTGASLRLPAGAYRLLVERGAAGARSAGAVLVRVGERVEVALPTAAAWRVRVDADAALDAAVLDGWHGVPLAADEDGMLTLWPTAAAEARSLEIATRGPHGARRWQRITVARDRAASTLPPTTWRALRADAAAAIVTLQPLGAGEVRALAWSPVEGGVAHVPEVADAHHVTLRADGGIVAWSGDARADAVATDVLVVAVRDAERPIVGALVELDGPAPQVRRRVATDGRGQARFAGVPRAQAFVRLVHDELCSDDLELRADTIHAALHRLHARPGATLQGRIALPDAGIAPSAVEVTLRDPTGADGLTPRRVPVHSDGTFAFRGLDADRRYTLFASLRRGSVTFSAKLHGVSTDAPVLLTLRSEDPQPPGRGR